MLVTFIFILVAMAVFLLGYAVRNVAGILFQYTADYSKSNEDQYGAARVFQKLNYVGHYTVTYASGAVAVGVGVWLIQLAICLM